MSNLPVLEGEAVQQIVPLTREQQIKHVQVVQEVMKSVMQKDQHYGVIPGCGDKPTLLKAGAEKLMHAFNFAADPQVEDLFPHEDDITAYRVTCRVIHAPTGNFLGAGIGECSSEEDKFKWRKAVCQEEWDATYEDQRRIKYQRTRDSWTTIAQVRTSPADLANTILKMAKKRALVDATLTVCAASDIFTQDIEEMEPTGNQGSVRTTKTVTAPPTLPEEAWIAGQVTRYEIKTGGTGKRTWKRHNLTMTLPGHDHAVVNMGTFTLPRGWDSEILTEYARKEEILLFCYRKNDKGYSELTALSPNHEAVAQEFMDKELDRTLNKEADDAPTQSTE